MINAANNSTGAELALDDHPLHTSDTGTDTLATTVVTAALTAAEKSTAANAAAVTAVAESALIRPRLFCYALKAHYLNGFQA
jgi:hypothetical protein